MMLIGEIVIVLLAVVGLVAICWKIADCLLEPESSTEVLVILPFSGRVENIEQQLRHAVSRFRKMTKNPEVGWLICLDNGMTEETRCVCARICDEYEFMNLCTPQELGRLIS
ncbi:MAG: hypothetical protein PUC32_00435 [Oscillospiraceae bacterium]|nr:hypothetical protein [Oscillospiraceae bacterium]